MIRATVHAPIEVTGLTVADQEEVSNRVYALILAELNRYRAEDRKS